MTVAHARRRPGYWKSRTSLLQLQLSASGFTRVSRWTFPKNSDGCLKRAADNNGIPDPLFSACLSSPQAVQYSNCAHCLGRRPILRLFLQP